MSDICSLKFQSVALATNSCFLLACWLWLHVLIHICRAFSALTLLVEWQEGHPVCRNWVMRCWCGYLSGVKCRLFACRPCCPTLAWFKSRLFFCLSGTILLRLSWKRGHYEWTGLLNSYTVCVLLRTMALFNFCTYTRIPMWMCRFSVAYTY